MRLDEDEYYAFMNIYLTILFWAGVKGKIIPKKTTLNDFAELDIEVKIKCREFFHSSDEYLHRFLMDDVWLTPDEHAEAEQFAQKVTGSFIVLKALKKHYIFLHDENVYAVLALNDLIEELIQGITFPIYIGDTVLLPFRNKIVYDGFFGYHQMSFGRNITKGFNEQYMKAKSQGAIITAL